MTPVIAAALARAPRRRPKSARGEGCAENPASNSITEALVPQPEMAEGGGDVEIPASNSIAEAPVSPPKTAPGGGGIEIPASNSIAQAPRRRGAPQGNRNGWKHGRRSAERRAHDAAIAKYLRGVNHVCREIDRMVRERVDRRTLDARVCELIPKFPHDVLAAEFAHYDPRTRRPV